MNYKAVLGYALVSLLASVILATEDKEHNAVWDLRKWSCEIKGNKALIKIHNQLSVRNARGDNYTGLVFLEDRFHKIKRLSIVVKDEHGEVIASYSKGDLTKECGFGHGYEVYADICHYYFVPKSPRYPYVIEYEFQQELKSLFFLRGPKVVSELPAKQATCELTVPDELTIHWKSYGLDMEFRERAERGQRVYIWEASNLPPVDKDTLSAVEATRAGTIAMIADEFTFAGKKFSGCTWGNVGQWYADIVRDRYDYTETVPDSSSPSPELMYSTMKAAYEAVRDESRYVAVSIGVNGWRPRKAVDTRVTRYGDCKDLSTLLISNLRQQGVAAFPALILTRDEGPIDTSFPGFGFNHVIVASVIESDTVWMDPTCDVCSFGELPWVDDGASALLVTDSGGRIIRIPGSTSDDNMTLRHVRIEIDQSFRPHATGHVSIAGLSAHHLRRILPSLGHKEKRQLVKKMIKGSSTQYALLKYHITGTEDVDGWLEMDFDALAESPLRPISGIVYLDPILFGVGIGFGASDLQDRRRPVEIRYPRTIRDSVLIVWDTNLAIDSIIPPRYDKTSHTFADRTLSSTLFEDSAVVVMSHSYKVYEIPPDDFDSLLQYEDMLRSRSAQHIRYILHSRR